MRAVVSSLTVSTFLTRLAQLFAVLFMISSGVVYAAACPDAEGDTITVPSGTVVTGACGLDGPISNLIVEVNGEINSSTDFFALLVGAAGSLINSGNIAAPEYSFAILVQESLDLLENRQGGSVSATETGIVNVGTIGGFINRGMIDGDDATADTLNGGVIGYLENAQLGLSLGGNLPQRYATVISDGQAGGLDYLREVTFSGHHGPQTVIAQNGGAGCMQFEIAEGSEITRTAYANVLTGILPEQLCATEGSFQGKGWTLQPSSLISTGSNSEILAQDNHSRWDLIFDRAVPAPIPTLSHLGMAVLAALTGLIGFRSRRHNPY